MTRPDTRFHEIDLLRGLACAAVVAFHYLSRGPRANWISGVNFPAVESVARYGYLGVDLFFLISGFVILMSAQGATPRDFVASRVARLFPALWIAAPLTAGTAWLLHEPRFAISLPHFLLNLTMVPHWFKAPYVDGAYWSLAVELHFYIFVWLALRLGQMPRLEWLLAAWLIVSALNALRPAWPVEFWLNARWAPYFIAGGIFFRIRTLGLSRLRAALLCGSWPLAVLYAARNAPSAGVDAAIVSVIVSAFFIIFLMIAFGDWRMAPSRLTIWSGLLTYPVYLIHQNFGMMLHELLHPVLDHAPTTLAITTAIVLLLGGLIHRLIETPLGPALRRRVAGKTA